MTKRLARILLACSLLAGPTAMVVRAGQDKPAGDTMKDDKMDKGDMPPDKMPKHKKANKSKKQDKMPGGKMDKMIRRTTGATSSRRPAAQGSGASRGRLSAGLFFGSRPGLAARAIQRRRRHAMLISKPADLRYSEVTPKEL